MPELHYNLTSPLAEAATIHLGVINEEIRKVLGGDNIDDDVIHSVEHGRFLLAGILSYQRDGLERGTK